MDKPETNEMVTYRGKEGNEMVIYVCGWGENGNGIEERKGE